ncbi:neuropeptide FF receptor 1-like [Montipora capricornis]|uniref:neuropeptide FF receptor 1-like n=1 Tax=Montipora capricornis TaxID=246305 RepID=UPI0035F121FF
MSTALPFTLNFIIVYSVEALIIILGNSLTVFVFWKHNIQRRACFFLINLAVADLLVGIAEPIVQDTGKFSKIMAEERRRGKKSMKPPAAALHLFASSASVFFLALIAMERVFAILRPLLRITSNRAYVLSVAIAWIAGLSVGGLSLLSMFTGFCPRCVTSQVTWFVNVLHLANSMVNPLVYAFRVPAFQDALKKVYHMRNKNLDIRKVNDFALSPAERPFTLHKDAIFTSDFPR